MHKPRLRTARNPAIATMLDDMGLDDMGKRKLVELRGIEPLTFATP